MPNGWQSELGPVGLLLRWLVGLWVGVAALLLVAWVMVKLFWLVLWAFVVAVPIALIYGGVRAIRAWALRRRAARQGHQVVEVRRVVR